MECSKKGLRCSLAPLLDKDLGCMGIGPKENVQLGNDTGIGPSAASNQRIGDRTQSLEVDRAGECIWHRSAVDAGKSRGTSLGGEEIAMRRSDR